MRDRSRRRAAVVTAAVLAGLAVPQVAGAATVSLWHMNEHSGTTMRDSGPGANKGSLTKVTRGRPGVFSPGYGFNGSTSIVKVNPRASLNPGSRDFSVTAYVNFAAAPTAAVGDFDLARKGLSSTLGGGWKMEIVRGSGGTAGIASCHFKGSSGSATITDGPNLADGQWHAIMCAKTSGAVSLTVSGQTYTKSGAIGSVSNSAKLTLGAKLGGGDWFKGTMDEVSFSVS
jgi:hypothetical protein